MAYKSTYVTALEPARVESYKLSLNSKVSTETLNVNDAAKDYYEKIVTNYNNIKKYFTNLGDEFIAAKKNVTGSNLKQKLQKIGNICKQQGNFCTTRKNELTTLFEYADLEQRISDLEAALSNNEI